MAKEDNLTPFTKENAKENGLKGGKAKAGVIHLSTLIKNIGDTIDWDKTTLKDKAQMKELYGKSGWKAIVYVAFTKASSGDIRAMEWLRKAGYGDKVTHEFENSFFNDDKLTIEVVNGQSANESEAGTRLPSPERPADN